MKWPGFTSRLLLGLIFSEGNIRPSNVRGLSARLWYLWYSASAKKLSSLDDAEEWAALILLGSILSSIQTNRESSGDAFGKCDCDFRCSGMEIAALLDPLSRQYLVVANCSVAIKWPIGT